MAAKRHTHKYHRIPFGGGKVWACALLNEGCTHHIPSYMESTILNRKSICWDCGSEFILNANSIEKEKPICKECSGLSSIESILEQKLAK